MADNLLRSTPDKVIVVVVQYRSKAGAPSGLAREPAHSTGATESMTKISSYFHPAAVADRHEKKTEGTMAMG
jgi:hypothetical protein